MFFHECIIPFENAAMQNFPDYDPEHEHDEYSINEGMSALQNMSSDVFTAIWQEYGDTFKNIAQEAEGDFGDLSIESVRDNNKLLLNQISKAITESVVLERASLNLASYQQTQTAGLIHSQNIIDQQTQDEQLYATALNKVETGEGLVTLPLFENDIYIGVDHLKSFFKALTFKPKNHNQPGQVFNV